MMSSDRIWSVSVKMPSVRANPMAKSRKCCGVAIITAWVVPLTDTATAVSFGTSYATSVCPSDVMDKPCAKILGDCAAWALYCSCQSVGPFDGLTCTAVTLYSGQLVAQSE